MKSLTIVPNQRVRVTQVIQTRNGPWTTSIEGSVISLTPQATGSWFAHGKHDRLWLDRLRLRKDDGEIVELVLCDDTVVNPIQKDAKP